jgi:hypothetical protein
MFIHCASEKGADCDNCGTCLSIMHMWIERSQSSVHLCIGCFGTLAHAIGHASKQLRIAKSKDSEVLSAKPVLKDRTMLKSGG